MYGLIADAYAERRQKKYFATTNAINNMGANKEDYFQIHLKIKNKMLIR